MLRAFLARPADARLGLFAGDALLAAGAIEAAVAAWSLAEDANPQLRRLKDAANVPAPARAASARADRVFREHFTRLHAEAMDAAAARGAGDIRRVRNAVWPLTHDGPVDYRAPGQRPIVFYMPDLPPDAVMLPDRLPWARGLEEAWETIRDEYREAVAAAIDMDPYVPAATRDPKWQALRGRLDWSSIHLYKEARTTDHTDRFPRTLAALADVDLVRVDGVPMEVLFSRLKPGAHIPPHHGLTNTRLTTHLPLIVPEHCAIRIGAETHEWREAELLAFDDSFEHEAWNRSDRDRVVLILHAHRPDLTEAERLAIEEAYAVRQHWLDGRRSLLGEWLGAG